MVEPKRKLTDDPVVLRIMNLIKQRNLTEKDLIDQLGMSRNAFTSWKYAGVKSYRRYIDQIAEILDVSPNYLLRGNEEVEIETLSETEKKMIKIYRSAGAKGQQTIRDMMNFIKKATEKDNKNIKKAV